MKTYLSPDKASFTVAETAPEGWTEQEASGVDQLAQAQAALRTRRDALLRASDFYMLADAPVSSEQRLAVAEYRQALRDLPEQAIDPSTVLFPRNPIV